MNGFSTEEDSRNGHDQICCLIDNSNRCTNQAGNASYSKRIQKTVHQRKLKLVRDDSVSMRIEKTVHQRKLKIVPDDIVSMRIQKTVHQRKLKLVHDDIVSMRI